MSTLLHIEFCGEVHTVTEDRQFTFGRAGDLVIDENRFLHRELGLCFYRSGWWWLHNAGSHLPLHLQGNMGNSSITLSPGSSAPLVLGPAVVRFAAGGMSYELTLDAEAMDVAVPHRPSQLGDSTIDAADMPLTSEQLILLIALAEPRLRHGPTAELLPNQVITERFGWTTTKFNRKLDNLCVKFSRRGVAGLVGGNGRAAGSRRHALVEHVIATGMITADQLSLLPRNQGSAPASQSTTASVRSKQR